MKTFNMARHNRQTCAKFKALDLESIATDKPSAREDGWIVFESLVDSTRFRVLD